MERRFSGEARPCARMRERQSARGRFYTHLMLYATVNAILLMINIVTPGAWWFLWPLLVWGIAVAAHAVQLFVLSGAAGERADERGRCEAG